MNEKTERDWAAERLTRNGDLLIELATRLRGGADPEWITREVNLAMADVAVVIGDLLGLSSERPNE